MNELNKKLGPLKLWQWLVIGLGTGGVIYLWKRSHEGSTAKEVNPEEEEKLLGALRAAGSGGGGESSGGGGSNVAAPGPVGLTGEAGAPGIAGPQGEAFNPAPIESRLSSVEQQLSQNNPAAALTHTAAPAKKAAGDFTHVNPANGQHYKIEHEKGKTVHVYRNGHRVVVGGAKKPTGHQQKPRPAKRPKPHPIHKRVTVHHPAPHRAAPKPVHHPAPKRKRR